jgi:hypothetical protein
MSARFGLDEGGKKEGAMSKERRRRLQLIQQLGKHHKTMAESWMKLAVGAAIAGLYSELAGDENWLMKGLDVPDLPTERGRCQLTVTA